MPSMTIQVRRMTPEDIPVVQECAQEVYRDYPVHELFSPRQYEMQIEAFPEGQFVAVHEGRIVGYASSMVVQLEDEERLYTYAEITGMGTFNTHNQAGDTLYGTDIGVHPDYRGRGIAGRIYRERKKLMKRHNLRRMVAYGRLPGYKERAGRMTPEEYVTAVERGEEKDSALNAHLKAGYRVQRVLVDFVRDPSSLNFATWLEMDNPHFKPERRKLAAAPIKRMIRKVRVCGAQFLMRRIQSWEEFEQAVEFFVDSADYYHSHFLLFPELFTANLFSIFPNTLGNREAMMKLAGTTDRYIEMMVRKAQAHSLHIIGGSHPTLRDGKLFNTAYLFTPSGKVYTQDKLHITPAERQTWGFQPGDGIKIFETPLGRIAILVCYDVEFPELARLVGLGGAEILFVPFSTDEKKAYYRVRITARARAVENYIYVVIAGNVGNLPSVKSYLVNYGQAAVFTPSDFAFPPRAIEAEADPNLEGVVIAELDLSTLEIQREIGSVRPLYDRRVDLYDLVAKVPVQFIRTE